MATSTSTGAGAPDKCNPPSFPTAVPFGVAGVVQHPLITPLVQVQILSVVDETGAATVGDLIEELPDHVDPVEAVIALVEAGVLTLDVRGHLDANTIAQRVGGTAPETGSNTPPPPTPGPASGLGGVVGLADTKSNALPAALPTSLSKAPVSELRPVVVVGRGSHRRDFGRAEALASRGVYAMIGNGQCYVGYGGSVGSRIATGTQPIGRVDTIIGRAHFVGAYRRDTDLHHDQ